MSPAARPPTGCRPAEFASRLAFASAGVDTHPAAWLPRGVRKSASIRLGILLAVSALLSCEAERPPERRCVDGDGRFADDSLCAQDGNAAQPDGGVPAGATGSWGATDGAAPARGGYHFVWIPYGAFGGVGAYAPGYRPGGTARPTGATGEASGAATSGSVSRGGFGATGAAHAGASGGGHASAAAGS